MDKEEIIKKLDEARNLLTDSPRITDTYCFKCNTINTCEKDEHLDYQIDMKTVDDFLEYLESIEYLENK